MKNKTQIKIILAIFGDDFIPEKISALIEVKPTDAWIKGSEIPLRQGLHRKDNKTRLREESVWEYSTGFIETLDIGDVMTNINRVFQSKLSVVQGFIKQNNLKAKLDVVIEIKEKDVPAVYFDKDILEFCVKLNAEIDIDIYMID